MIPPTSRRFAYGESGCVLMNRRSRHKRYNQGRRMATHREVGG